MKKYRKLFHINNFGILNLNLYAHMFCHNIELCLLILVIVKNITFNELLHYFT